MQSYDKYNSPSSLRNDSLLTFFRNLGQSDWLVFKSGQILDQRINGGVYPVYHRQVWLYSRHPVINCMQDAVIR